MNTCHDCQKEIIEENGEVKNGKLLKYLHGDEELYAYKCDECYEKSPALRRFQKCEVYSRVCGYIRPTSQWSLGKAKEYEDRVEFKN